MTGPACPALYRGVKLGVMACGAACLVRRYLHVFKGAVTLETFNLVKAVTGVEPLFVYVRGNIHMTVRAGDKFFLLGEGRVPCCPGCGRLIMAGACAPCHECKNQAGKKKMIYFFLHDFTSILTGLYSEGDTFYTEPQKRPA
jgi:hypothetical protein